MTALQKDKSNPVNPALLWAIMIFFKFMVSCEWAIQEKIQTKWGGGGWGLTSFKEKSLKFLELSLCLYHWSFNTWKFHKIVITIGISKPKTKTHAMEILHGFFITPGNSTSLLLTPLLNLKFPHSVYLFNTLGNLCPQPPSLFGFFWNGICKLIKTCHWGTVTWVIFGIWKKNETNHVSKNSFKRHNINYTLMKYSTYNM